MKKIKDLTIHEYILLKSSGMFWEIYPEATGDYEKDKILSATNKFNIESDMIEHTEYFEHKNHEAAYLVYISFNDANKQKCDLFKFSKSDPFLNEYIDKEITTGNLKNIEVFKRDNNIIVTENGYYMACYESDLNFNLKHKK